MEQLRQEASYVLKTEGLDEAASKMDDLAESNESAAAKTAILSRQQNLQEQSITRVAAKLEMYARAQDPVYRALAQVERGERLIAAARAKGISVSDAAVAGLEQARETCLARPSRDRGRRRARRKYRRRRPQSHADDGADARLARLVR